MHTPSLPTISCGIPGPMSGVWNAPPLVHTHIPTFPPPRQTTHHPTPPHLKGPGTRDTLPPLQGQTDICENITFPQLHLRAVKIKNSIYNVNLRYRRFRSWSDGYRRGRRRERTDHVQSDGGGRGKLQHRCRHWYHHRQENAGRQTCRVHVRCQGNRQGRSTLEIYKWRLRANSWMKITVLRQKWNYEISYFDIRIV